jgi:predicted nuclease with TOPRIM domain
MLQELQKQEERVRNEIALIKEEFQSRVNTINDLGHSFENLTNHIEIICSHSNVLQKAKECLDRLSILLN